VTKFVDFWYKVTDHFGLVQARAATRCFVPGPAGLWKKDKFIEIFAHHPALPFGEDIFGGFTTLNFGYAIRAEHRCMVTTFSPNILLNVCAGVTRTQGYGASSIWKQRANRWTLSALRITGKSLYSFFTYDTTGGIFPNIAFRVYRFREYKILLVQLMYIPFVLILLSRGFYVEFFVLKLALLFLPLLKYLIINYICWHGKPELQVELSVVLTAPLYNMFLILCAVHGRLKCLLWYLPYVAPNHGMLNDLKPKDLDQVPCDSCKGSADDDINVNFSSSNSKKEIVSTVSSPSSRYQVLSPGENSVEEITRNSPDALSIPEVQSAATILKTRPDSYELFEKDGSSSVIFWKVTLTTEPSTGRLTEDVSSPRSNHHHQSERGVQFLPDTSAAAGVHVDSYDVLSSSPCKHDSDDGDGDDDDGDAGSDCSNLHEYRNVSTLSSNDVVVTINTNLGEPEEEEFGLDSKVVS
jgi:hypothetical protein